MKIKHVFLFVILTLAVLMTAAVCSAEEASLGFSQELFMPVFLSYAGISDADELQYTPAENAEETAVLELAKNTQLELDMLDGTSGMEVNAIKLTARIRVKPREGEKEAFNHHVTACLRTVAALTGWDAGDEELQAFLDGILAEGFAETATLCGVYEQEELGSHYLAKFSLANVNSSYLFHYDKAAYKAFEETLSAFKQAGTIPEDKAREILNTDDFTDEWAMLDVPHWKTFASAKNFAVTAEVTWSSAYELPNTASGGCGFVFREAGEDEYMLASLRMDGVQYLTGKHNWNMLSYPNAFFDLPEISGTHQLTVLANEEWVHVYMDGILMNSYYGAALMEEGGLGFATLAGTNYDFGTRCEFKNVFYTVW